MSVPPNQQSPGDKIDPRPARKPRIPDHEVMRCIGRGSYGEVWLAKTVTGSMRAVKVVRREDFEAERTFEREFEGILKFEPISRNHPGLVDVLHVGRNESEGFYYYVMELADDRERGQKIHPVDYEPRTLSADRVTKKRFDVEDTVSVGISLAGALHHLHERGLTHRDVKPSNIIFVEGVPKLADIGLVAEAGQGTYVGTEGFVPPEGPGTSQSDIYSLGMVLYELSTGKDRLCFPELAADAGLDSGDKKRWRMLNEAICKACHPNPHRRFATARHLIDALRKVRMGKYKRPIFPRAAAFFTASSLIGFSLAWAKTGQMPWPPGALGQLRPIVVEVKPEPVKPPPVGKVQLLVESEPPGAEITMDDRNEGVTPYRFKNLPTGKHSFKVKLGGYQTVVWDMDLVDGPNPPKIVKLVPNLPAEGKPWVNSLGMKFVGKGDRHISMNPVTAVEYDKLTGYNPADTVGNKALVEQGDAEDFCKLLLEADAAGGRLNKSQYHYEPKFQYTVPPPTKDLTKAEITEAEAHHPMAFHCVLLRKQFGDILISSEPPGAQIFIGDAPIGKTDPTKLIENRPVGKLDLRLVMTGYEDYEVKGFTVVANKKTQIKAVMQRSRKAVLGADYENSLSMKFKPVTGTDVIFSVWETRKQDYDYFLQSTQLQSYSDDKGCTNQHPVAVTRDDAMSFCKWLTMRERNEGLLPAELEYRLPSDEEWSVAADLHEKPKPNQQDPSGRNQKIKGIYIWGWGDAWPPPRDPQTRPGNFSDISRQKHNRKLPDDKILGLADQTRYEDGKPYEDGYPFAAPVGKFTKNRFELYDLCGNVSEWVMDDYGGSRPELAKYGVVRGGNWAEYDKGDLLASSRNAVRPNYPPDGLYGFRCVIAKIKPPSGEPVLAPKPRVIE